MNGHKTILVSFDDVINHIICLSFAMEILFYAPFTIGSFRFEWPYFSCILLFATIIIKRDKSTEKNRLKKCLYLFFLWCMILCLFSLFRFSSSIYIVGIAHTVRMMVLFLPYIWFVFYSDESKRILFYRTFRIYIFFTLVILLMLSLAAGGIYNKHSFGTAGVGKNSLGYTIVCLSLVLAVYENKTIVDKPVKPYVWLPLCILLCVFTKSGTAVIFILAISVWYFIRSNKLSKFQNTIILIIFCIIIIPFLNIDYFIQLFDRLHVYKITEFLQGIKDSGGTSFGHNNDVRIEVQISGFRDFNLNMAMGSIYGYFLAFHGYTAHQLYLQILYDTGILGIVLFIRFCIENFKTSKFKIPVLLILAYSCIEVFLIQYTSLIVLALVTGYISPKNND